MKGPFALKGCIALCFGYCHFLQDRSNFWHTNLFGHEKRRSVIAFVLTWASFLSNNVQLYAKKKKIHVESLKANPMKVNVDATRLVTSTGTMYQFHRQGFFK